MRFIDIFSNIIGMIGVVFVLIVYFLSQVGRLSVHSLTYLFGNLLGSLFIVFSLFFHWNLSSFLIEVAWAGITIMGLVKVYREKKENSKKMVMNSY